MQDWIELVERARRRDRGAFDALVACFRDMAVGYAFSLLKDFHLAEDAAQEAFIRAFHDLPALREAKAFPAWLRRIVFKYCDRFKRRKRHSTVTIDLAAEKPDGSDEPSLALEKRETARAVLACIRALPANERTATTLFYINGYSAADVGRFLEVPAGTVKSRLHSARQKLKKRMVSMIKSTLSGHAPNEDFNTRIREVLDRVPLVDFELYRRERPGGAPRCPESVPFPSCLRAYLEFIGRGDPPEIIEAHGRKWRLDHSYVMAMGASGAAFKLNWAPGFRPEITTVFSPDNDPWSPQKKALEAMGLPYEILDNNGRNRELFIKKIKESIHKFGRPCIARGLVGPPEECLITGFDKNGAVLIGWSFFQREKEFLKDVEFEANGYFRKADWYGDTPGLIVLGERKARPPSRESALASLRWGVRMLEAETAGPGIPAGISAYRAWIDTLADESRFSGKKVKDLVSQYVVHHANVGLLAECRWYGHLFIDRILKEMPFPKTLETASGCFANIHDVMWKIWNAVGGIGVSPVKAKEFARPAVRQKIIALLEEARELDRTALESLKKAL